MGMRNQVHTRWQQTSRLRVMTRCWRTHSFLRCCRMSKLSGNSLETVRIQVVNTQAISFAVHMCGTHGVHAKVALLKRMVDVQMIPPAQSGSDDDQMALATMKA